MTLTTPENNTIEVCDNSRDTSALRYLRFSQAWARETGLGSDLYDTDSHLTRLGLFLGQKEYDAARTEYNNLVLGLANLASTDAQHLQAAVLAPLVLRISGTPYADLSEAGLRATTQAVLASGITQGALVEAVELVKKNLTPT